jgi:hypothetical protein
MGVSPGGERFLGDTDEPASIDRPGLTGKGGQGEVDREPPDRATGQEAPGPEAPGREAPRARSPGREALPGFDNWLEHVQETLYVDLDES